MKKIYIILFATLSLSLLLSYPIPASADLCIDITTGTYTVYDFLQDGRGLVPCGQTPGCRCELGHLFVMAAKIYDFVLKFIAVPLTAILIVAGGITFILAAGKPELASRARQMLWGAAIGILLIFGSWIMVDVVLKIIGYTGPWSSFSF